MKELKYRHHQDTESHKQEMKEIKDRHKQEVREREEGHKQEKEERHKQEMKHNNQEGYKKRKTAIEERLQAGLELKLRIPCKISMCYIVGWIGYPKIISPTALNSCLIWLKF